MIAMVFILYHVWSLHTMGRPLGGGQFDHEHATSTAAIAIGQGENAVKNLLLQVGYAVGVLACVFHLANGLFTMGITWGVWTSPSAQRRADYVCAGFGILLAVVAMSALYGMGTVDVADAQAMEKARILERQEREQRIKQLRGAERPITASVPDTIAVPAKKVSSVGD
jgi:succinate dehydrogenase / fumarate reductase cytochrome b subunit